MEIRLFTVAGKTFTRFKVLISQYRMFGKILKSYGITKPTKQNSRYVYFEAEGDFLNAKEAE